MSAHSPGFVGHADCLQSIDAAFSSTRRMQQGPCVCVGYTGELWKTDEPIEMPFVGGGGKLVWSKGPFIRQGPDPPHGKGHFGGCTRWPIVNWTVQRWVCSGYVAFCQNTLATCSRFFSLFFSVGGRGDVMSVALFPSLVNELKRMSPLRDFQWLSVVVSNHF